MRTLSNSWTMTKRCLLVSLRNPDGLAITIMVPAMVMALFVLIFGGIADVGDYSYIDFIVPGIILQTAGQAVAAVAINVNNDMRKGMNDRFRSMQISKSSVLTGHVMASLVRNIISTTIVIGVAFILGFRPTAGFVDWLVISGIIVLYMLMITWISVIAGVVSKSPESASGGIFLLFILPYVSSGFTPLEALPSWLRGFAEHQPMTPIIDSLRGTMLGLPVETRTLTLAIVWCVAITVVSFLIATQIYNRKIS
ncbi:MAG: ABC transporter permease [Oscillospiraceae bacterium]|nr:ABC transporter permease [Oscillospiraceae bacterium]